MAEKLERVHAWVETGETRKPKAGEYTISAVGGGTYLVEYPGNVLREIVEPVPGPLYRLGPGEMVISECPKEEATHVRLPLPALGRIVSVDDWKTHYGNWQGTCLRIEPVAVPRDERAEARRSAIEAFNQAWQKANQPAERCFFEALKAYEAALAAKGVR